MKTILTAIVIVALLSTFIQVIWFYFKSKKEIKQKVPYEVFKDLTNNKCNADCQNCVCEKQH